MDRTHRIREESASVVDPVSPVHPYIFLSRTSGTGHQLFECVWYGGRVADPLRETKTGIQISNSKFECSKRTETRASSFEISNIIYLKLFRISCFGFRVSDENLRKKQNFQTLVAQMKEKRDGGLVAGLARVQTIRCQQASGLNSCESSDERSVLDLPALALVPGRFGS